MKKEILLQEPTTANGIIADNANRFLSLQMWGIDWYTLNAKCNSILS